MNESSSTWDIDRAVPVALSFFEAHLLPPCPIPGGASVIESIAETLVKGICDTEKGTCLDSERPSEWATGEKRKLDTFDNFARIVLETYPLPSKARTTAFACNLNSTPSCYALRTHDTVLVYDPRSRATLPRWTDIAVPGEFKRTKEPLDRDNVSLRLRYHIVTDLLLISTPFCRILQISCGRWTK